MTTGEVLSAVREQNVQVAAGQIGQPPAPRGQSFQFAVNVLGRLTEIEQFEEIIVKTGEGGRITRLKDVARTELGGKTYDVTSRLSGAPLGRHRRLPVARLQRPRCVRSGQSRP